MPRTIYITIRIVIVIIAGLILIQPFNWFCQATSRCKPFYFSYYIPKQLGGDELNIKLEITNYSPDLDFTVNEASKKIFGNQKAAVTYHAKNKSKRIIKIHPTLFIEPEYAKKYVIRYECLCSRSYKISPQEQIEMNMEFEVDDAITEDPNFDKSKPNITIRYKVEPVIVNF